MFVTEKSAADVLAEAREYIEVNGWCQDVLVDDDGAVCARGAIILSQGMQSSVDAFMKAEKLERSGNVGE
jgi:hypothetical protein